MSTNAPLLAARILLAALFLVSGLGILTAPAGFAGYMGAIGLPFPLLVTWLVIAIKVIGAVALVVGFHTRTAALVIAAFSIGAAFLGHLDFADQNETTAFLKNLAIAGGFLALFVSGPGEWSLDARRGETRPAHA